MGEGGQKVLISICKINQSQGCNVQHEDYIQLVILRRLSETCSETRS